AQGLQEVATTDDAQQLSPGPAIGMAIGAEIPPTRPAPIGTVRIGAEMVRGVDLAAAPPRHDEARAWGGRGVWVGGAYLCTVGAMRLGSEARKGFRLTLALGP